MLRRHAVRHDLGPRKVGASRNSAGRDKIECHGEDPDLDPDIAVAAATSHAEQRWPQIQQIQTRYRAGFAYVDAVVPTEKPSDSAGSATADQPTSGASRSTEPAMTTTKTPTCPPVPRWHLRTSPRHRLRPVPQRPHRLDTPPTTNRRDH